MKKIISILLVIFFIWITLWDYTCPTSTEVKVGSNYCCDQNSCNNNSVQCRQIDNVWNVLWYWNMPWFYSQVCWSLTSQNTWWNNTWWNNTWSSSPTSIMGITCDQDQLVNGQCKLNIYDTLGIRKSVRDKWDPTSVGLFVQDIILSATMFIGTLVTIALIVSWLMFIFAASSGKDPADAKKGIMGSLIGLLLVVSSYVIIRLIQYIAKGF